MKALISKLYNDKGQEIGSVLTAILDSPPIPTPAGARQSLAIENQLREYGSSKVYPNERVAVYTEMYAEPPSVIIINSSLFDSFTGGEPAIQITI